MVDIVKSSEDSPQIEKMNEEQLKEIVCNIAREYMANAVAFSSYPEEEGASSESAAYLVEIYRMINENIYRGKTPLKATKLKDSKQYVFVYGSAKRILEDEAYLDEFIEIIGGARGGVETMVKIV